MSGPETIQPEGAPALGVALRWFLAGLAALVALLLVALDNASLLAADYLHNPATLAVTHLFTLGFAGAVVCGAVYQLTPVLLHVRLHSERLADAHLALHAGGALAMVMGFYEMESLWVIGGGLAVTTGALLQALNVGLTWRRAVRWNWHVTGMAAALLYFWTTLGWGIVLAFNQRYGFLNKVEGAPLSGHLALGLLGFFSLMILAVGLKLVPMFAPGRPLPPRFVGAVVAAMAGGVALTVTGLLAGAIGAAPGPLALAAGPLSAAGLALVVAALLAYAGAMLYTLRHRRPGGMDFSVRFAVTAGALLPVPVAALPFASRSGQAGLVFFFAMTFIGGTILGMLLRIVPFKVWLYRFRHRTHKQEKIPFLHEMFPRWPAWVAYGAWFPGVALTSLGMGLRLPPLIVAGVLVALVALAGVGVVLGATLWHVPPGRPGRFN